MNVLPASMSVCHVSGPLEEGMESGPLKLEVSRCEPPCGCWEYESVSSVRATSALNH